MKLYVVWSKTFNSLVGVYSDETLANKLALTQAGMVIETDLNHVHPGHAETLREICGILVPPDQSIEFSFARNLEQELDPVFEAHSS